ncbi:phosphatidylinositol alpha-mannosyltransferase [Sediminihabitans luteus]|uniref:D-inositol 3-phosphate glycosyltransferase n=1 Tax=Sediminihabitans luteus TaxID=1138585 RepID=A0A2M9CC81_9CELL|nr:glycosyltransferase family 4 protein [Sediminihabitans luteus]PJJ68646.1 phosphatidylinositol alpha-mannosyltransferase [Sediminihabitans luteus]GII99986.1 phosphatidyl-myo-inositol mannosyltransferase [Sediminihabitans luteus]
MSGQRLKIAFVFDDSLDAPDGVQQYVLMLGRAFRALGHEVHYLVGETARTDIEHVHPMSRNVGVRFNQNRMRIPLPASRRRIRELLAREQYDVLHVQVPFSPMMAARVVLAAAPTATVVGTFHIAPHSRLVAFANTLLGVWTRRALRRFDEIVAVSPVAADFARATFRVECRVVPNPVDLARFRAAAGAEPWRRGEAGRARRVVFLGRLVERKGAAQLLAALERAEQAPDWPRVEVVVAGDGPLRAALEAHAARLRTPVEFVGFVDEAVKPALLAEADVAVLPSTGGESFGIVLLEACAAGSRVVIAGDNPGYRSTFDGNEDLLVDPADVDAFAARLVRAVTDESFAERASAWQHAHVEQFDVERVAAQVLDTYAAHRPRP